MYTTTKTVPIQQAINDDQVVKEAAKHIASGAMSANAPAGLDKIVWTDADVKRLDDALAKRFGKK